MAAPYTIKRLTDVEDSAPALGFGEVQETRFASEDLDAERTGVAHHRIRAGRRQGIAHRHERAEEVYVVLAGSGRMKLDDDVIAIEPLDAIRVAPEVIRTFEAGPDGLEVLVIGARHDGDGEAFTGWWTDR
jgi:mannose-6-phosphate isomerase-like protein (cupin superfamily)